MNEAGIIYYHLAFTDEHRSIESLAKLAEFFANGVRVPKNYIFAYALSNFSSSVGVDAACALRDSLETKMSPEQVGKAQDISLEWNCLSQIKDHKFFPDWMRELPEYMHLEEEAKAKKLSDAEKSERLVSLFARLF